MRVDRATPCVVAVGLMLMLAACGDQPAPSGITPLVAPAGEGAFVVIGTSPAKTTTTVNDGPGDQTDPHVSGDFVAYTSNADGTNRIRYHNLTTGDDVVVPNAGEDDFLSDVSGTRIAFVRVNASSGIYAYEVGAAAAMEVAPSPTANRRNPAIGGNTVAWQDLGFSPSPLESEIVVADVTTGATTRLTTDAMLDRTPAVSPDGNVVVWIKCNTSGTACDVWKAVRVGTTWTTSIVVTGAAGEESSPDSDGQIIVYASTRAGETDVYWQPVAGGAENRLSLTGSQNNPSVSRGVIAFDSQDAGNVDVWMYVVATSNAFPITSTGAANETLNDVFVASDGLVRAVYQSDATGDLNVYAASFRLVADEVTVAIDVKPGSALLPIKLSGPLPVVSVIVRTTADFDAALIDAATATLGDGLGTDAGVAKTLSGLVLATLVDVDWDGDKDLVLAFRKADLVAAGDLTTTTSSFVFRAQLTDGRTARGEDAVVVIP